MDDFGKNTDFEQKDNCNTETCRVEQETKDSGTGGYKVNRNANTQYYCINDEESNNFGKSKMPGWLKAVIIIVLVAALLIWGCSACTASLSNVFISEAASVLGSNSKDVTVNDADGIYIGLLHVETGISEGGNTREYSHKYILNSIRAMARDEKNKGIILYLNTPGGSVFASDELYFAIKEYQKETGRPVYSAMQSMAASGGYYISAPCDKIFANRNCWTGSIGVTLGTMYDVSELLDNLGVKTVTITSGDNKAMGSNTEPMTKEQREIYQSLVDEAYEQFIDIVSEGRKMDPDEVKKIADGRIYTAKQALEIGLIDEIGTFEDALNDMKKVYQLEDAAILDFVPKDTVNILSYLGIIAENLEKSAEITPSEIQELIDMNGKFNISYEANIDR